MKLLGIETTGPFCSAALCLEDKIYEIAGTEKLNHLSVLTPVIKRLMEDKCVEFSELDGICVSEGPGSFTGIRIGVSTARALSQVTKVPIISVPTLYAFGRDILTEIVRAANDKKSGNNIEIDNIQRAGDIEIEEHLHHPDPDENKEIVVRDAFRGGYSDNIVSCPIFNARRNQIYAGAYTENKEIVKAGPYMLDEFMELAKIEISKIEKASSRLKIYFAGDGVDAYENNIIDIMPEAKFLNMYQRAHGICDMALYMMDNRKIFIDKIKFSHEEVKPNYMRMAEAERKLREGKL